MNYKTNQMDILKVSIQTSTFTRSLTTYTVEVLEYDEIPNDTCCDVLNKSACYTDVIKKELYKSNKNTAEKSKEDGSGSICNYMDSQAFVPYTESLSVIKNADSDHKSLEIRNRTKNQKLQRGGNIAHESNFNTNQVIDEHDVKDKKSIKRQNKRNGRELQRGGNIAHDSNFDTNQVIDEHDVKDKKSIKRQNKRNGRELQRGGNIAHESNFNTNQVIDEHDVKDKKSIKRQNKRNGRELQRGGNIAHESNFDTNQVIDKHDVKEKKSIKRQNKRNGRERETSVLELEPGDETKDNQNVDNSLAKDIIHLIDTPKSTQESCLGKHLHKLCRSAPDMCDSKWFIFVFLLTMLFSARVFCIDENSDLPKNEDITSHNVRNDDQETMVIEMKRVHPKPVCKLYIKKRMISDKLYNATTVRSVLRYYSLRFEFSRDFLVQYCYRVLKIICSVSIEKIHHNQTIDISSCSENTTKSDNTVAVIVTVTIFILILIAVFVCIVVYLKRQRVGPFRNNDNGPIIRTEDDKTSTMGTSEKLIIDDEKG